jgi:hypothetical protein
MLDNGDENTQQDAFIEEPSAPQTSDSQTSAPAPAPESESQAAKSVPFHEDPRVQEYVERQVRKQSEAYEQRFAEMQRQYQEVQSRIPSPEKAKDPFLAKLAEIDPAYAKSLEDVYTKASSVEELRQEMQELKRERIVNEYNSTVSKLTAESKLPPEVQELVRENLDSLAKSGAIRSMQDVPVAYKQLADKYSKLVDGIKRSTTASYVTDKSKDAAAPTSQPKGKTVPRNDKGQFAATGDWETDKAAIVARALKRNKAASEI